MPDLIIKPTTTSGNKLILQDQAGGAVLTTADSGATAANLTLASTTTFPAGHVIQTTTHTGSNTETTINTTNNQWSSTVVTGSITPKYSNSSIIIHASFSAEVNNASSEVGVGFKFYKEASGITASFPDSISGKDPTATNTHSQFYRNPHNYTEMIDSYELSWIDDNVSVADTAVTYTLYAAGIALSSCVIGASYGALWHIFFQEIKR